MPPSQNLYKTPCIVLRISNNRDAFIQGFIFIADSANLLSESS